MSRGPAVHVSLDVQIEQMLARGRSLDYILARLLVTTADVDAALQRMDDAVADDPWLTAVLG